MPAEVLLGRSEIHINMEEVMTEFCGKVVLVTGAAGSIGSELCRQLAQMNIKKLIMFDSAESPLHNVRLEFEKNYPGYFKEEELCQRLLWLPVEAEVERA